MFKMKGKFGLWEEEKQNTWRYGEELIKLSLEFIGMVFFPTYFLI